MREIANDVQSTTTMFYVYVLQSEADWGLYIGMSENLRRRFREHQQGESISTKSRVPWRLIYYEAYLVKEDAEGRERFLKSGSGRKFLDQQMKHYFRQFPRKSPRSLSF
jgi:putative endonuclease